MVLRFGGAIARSSVRRVRDCDGRTSTSWGIAPRPPFVANSRPYHSTGALPQPAENRTLTSDKTFLHDSDQYPSSNCPAKARVQFNAFYPQCSGPSVVPRSASARRSTADRILRNIGSFAGFVTMRKIRSEAFAPGEQIHPISDRRCVVGALTPWLCLQKIPSVPKNTPPHEESRTWPVFL